MRLFTTLQTESWQHAMIATFARTNDLDKLCWFVQMIVPLPKNMARTMSQQERTDYRYRTACAPNDWIPYIPIQDDPFISKTYAEILTAIFIAHNAPEYKFAPALALVGELACKKCYAFGREWDHVCAQCGSVFLSTIPNEVEICGLCNQHLYRMALQ